MRKQGLEITLTTAVACMLLSCIVTGCGDNKSAITEAELDRIAITQKIKLVEQAGGLAITVGGETITSDEVIYTKLEHLEGTPTLAESLKNDARTRTLEKFKRDLSPSIEQLVAVKMSNILLYQHARTKAPQGADEALDKEVEKQLREYVLGFGGDEARADEALQKIGLDRQKFKEQRKRLMLTRSYLVSKLPYTRPITYREMSDFYDANRDEFFAIDMKVKFRLIEIRPDRLQPAEPNQTPLEQLRSYVDRLTQEIDAGRDFAELVTEYSHGQMAPFGGLYGPVAPESLAEPYDALAAEAGKARPGQVIGPILNGGYVFVMKLEEKQIEAYRPFEQVQTEIEASIRAERENEVLNRINERLMEKAAIARTKDFADFCLERIYEISNQ